ncbi:integrase core domain-containing protein, partial [Sphingomonas sp. 37zxx]|uniref:integrase core domain-containing protein n=1 Tax=Sphingomonas sp. 37zxx TaxID=1550073 RepID=UPI0012E010FB
MTFGITVMPSGIETTKLFGLLLVWVSVTPLAISLLSGTTAGRPGKPTENAPVESSNGHLRDKRLNRHLFGSLNDARARIEARRHHCNEICPPTSPDCLTPIEYADVVAKIAAGGTPNTHPRTDEKPGAPKNGQFLVAAGRKAGVTSQGIPSNRLLKNPTV